VTAFGKGNAYFLSFVGAKSDFDMCRSRVSQAFFNQVDQKLFVAVTIGMCVQRFEILFQPEQFPGIVHS